jgi:hypothetical protein
MLQRCAQVLEHAVNLQLSAQLTSFCSDTRPAEAARSMGRWQNPLRAQVRAAVETCALD